MGEAPAAGWEAFCLPNFNGDGDLDEWVCKLETFFDFTGKPDAQRVVYATNRLTGRAHALWRNSQQQGSASWEGFKSGLRMILETGEKRSTEAAAAAALQQGDSSVAEYTSQFLELFVNGLSPEISALVKGAEPISFQEAVNLAVACEKMVTAGKKQQGNANSTKKQEPAAAAAAAARMQEPATPKRQELSVAPAAAAAASEDADENFLDVKRCFITYGEEVDYGYWFKGTVNNQPATFAHHNTSDNLISSSLVKRLDLPTVRCRPYMVETMNGTRCCRGDTMIRGLEYELEGGLRNRMDFAIVDKLPRHDVLLGWPFFGHANESVVFTKGGRVLVGPCTLQLYTGCPDTQR